MRILPLFFLNISLPSAILANQADFSTAIKIVREKSVQKEFKERSEALEQLLEGLEKEPEQQVVIVETKPPPTELLAEEKDPEKEESEELFALEDELLEWQEEKLRALSQIESYPVEIEEEPWTDAFAAEEEHAPPLAEEVQAPVAVIAAEESPPAQKSNAPIAYSSDSKPNLYPIPKRIDVRHNQGFNQRSNFGTDYTTVAMLLASDYVQGSVMPMIDLRAHHFDNNRYAANVGVGGRYIPHTDTFCELLGFNAYYDYRQGVQGHYNQVGLGIEVLGKRWEFRANAYFPIGIKRHKTKCEFRDFSGGFFAVNRRCEFTAYGYNAEVGYYPINGHTFSLYTAIGPYYLLRRCEHDTLGGLARARAQYRDYLALEGRVSYDPVFKTVYQLIVLFRLPLYQIFTQKNRKTPCGMFERQVYQPVERFEIMPLGRRSCWERNF